MVGIRSMGVEEELLLADPVSGAPLAVAGAVMEAGQVLSSSGGQEAGGGDSQLFDFELQAQQLETNTRPCVTPAELIRELRRCRTLAAEAAQRAGAVVVAVGTSPVPVQPETSGIARYQRMREEFGLTGQEQLTCGCHVHVEISSAEEGVAALDRMQPWLATILALSANSPFWQGTDSGYASFRYQAWGRWPSSGFTGWFGSARAYEATIRDMIQTQTLLDSGMIYFNARLSQHYPTVEVRIADVCLRADDAVLIAILVRALVETGIQAWRAGQPTTVARPELLALAAWRASRSGLEGELISPGSGRPAPAAAVVGMLLDHVRDALASAGDDQIAAGLAEAVLARGTGASFQREASRRGAGVADVVAATAQVTAPWPAELSG